MGSRPGYVLINSISRSGGTFLKALFDRVNGVLTFPIEFPTIKGQAVDFIKQGHFEKLITIQNWLDETDLSYHLNRFYHSPYGRTFGRHKRKGEPEIFFNYPRFLEKHGCTYSSLETVGAAYEQT